MKTQIVSVDINPWIKLIWIERLPKPLPKRYNGGRSVQQYRHTIKRALRLHDACSKRAFNWSQDGNGVHFQHPNFTLKSA